MSIPANQAWGNVFLQVGNNGHLTAIDGSITQPANPRVSFDLYRDKVSAGAANVDFDVFYFQHSRLSLVGDALAPVFITICADFASSFHHDMFDHSDRFAVGQVQLQRGALIPVGIRYMKFLYTMK